MIFEPPTIVDAVRSLCPSAEIVWDKSYDDWQYVVEPDNPPSDAEIKAEFVRLQNEFQAIEYQRLRAPEYPPLTQLADAIYWNEQGDPSKLAEYVAACDEVKAKYPKPDASTGN